MPEEQNEQSSPIFQSYYLVCVKYILYNKSYPTFPYKMLMAKFTFQLGI